MPEEEIMELGSESETESEAEVNVAPPSTSQVHTRASRRRAEIQRAKEAGKPIKVEKIPGTELLHSYYDEARLEPFNNRFVNDMWAKYCEPRDVADHIEGEILNIGAGEALLEEHPDLFELVRDLRARRQSNALFIWFKAYLSFLINPGGRPNPLCDRSKDDEIEMIGVEVDLAAQQDRKVVDLNLEEDGPVSSSRAHLKGESEEKDPSSGTAMKTRKKRRRSSTEKKSKPKKRRKTPQPKPKKTIKDIPVKVGGMAMPALEVEMDDGKEFRGGEVQEAKDEPWMGNLRLKAEPDLRDGVKLFHCQLHNLRWMCQVETKVRKKEHLFRRLPGLRGGLLADNVGYGKTLTCLTLMKIEPGHVAANRLGEKNARGLFLTNANLLICPSTLAYQWANEANKHFQNKVIKVITIVDFKTHFDTTYKDMCKADLVIVSDKFFQGKHYTSIASPLFTWEHSTMGHHSEFLIESTNPRVLTGGWGCPKGAENKVYKKLKISGSKVAHIYINRTKREPEVTTNKHKRTILVVDMKGKGKKNAEYRFLLVEVERWLEVSKVMGSVWDESTKEFVDRIQEEKTDTVGYVKTVKSTEWFPKIRDALRTGFGNTVKTTLLDIKHQGLAKESKKNWRKFVVPVGQRTLKGKCPRLDHFQWNRLFIDEVHDFLTAPHLPTSKRNFTLLSSIKSKIRWAITATPNPNPAVFAAIIKFLGSEINMRKSNKVVHSDDGPKVEFPPGFHPGLLRGSVLWKNSDEQAQDNEIPDLQEEVVYVEMHPLEKLMHDLEMMLKNEEKASEASTNIFGAYADMKLNPDGKLSLSNFLRRLMKTLEKKERKKREEATNLKAEYKRLKKTPNADQYQLRGVKSKFMRAGKKVNELAERINYINDREEIVIQDVNAWNLKTDVVAKSLVGEKGSKFASLISMIAQFLEQSPENRIVIFSQHKKALQDASKFLQAYSIKATEMKGTAQRRSNVLSSFQDRFDTDGKKSSARHDHRVVCLSTKYAASGADLHKVTHIVLLDPFGGCETEAYAAEKQAIGRAMRQGSKAKGGVKVLRFVTKNSVEEKLYIRNMKEHARRANAAKS